MISWYRSAGMDFRNVRYTALKQVAQLQEEPTNTNIQITNVSAVEKRVAFPTVEMSYNKLLAGPERMKIGFVGPLRVRGRDNCLEPPKAPLFQHESWIHHDRVTSRCAKHPLVELCMHQLINIGDAKYPSASFG